ncbi:MAG: deoxyguanosinetriphosphate triphosphohydrolase [Planctomycetota bacterium]
MTTEFLDPLDREESLLAGFAMRSRASRGRVHEDQAAGLRTAFQRDRDRIVHSTAFRRLQYKTQVFVNHEGDHYRTRLTHTLEVAQIARTVARALALNEDLVEAIALSHDLGHPPFGHAGEDQLHDLMAAHGGFNHNRHCLRVVDVLERRYPDFPGLNLSWELRESIAKHYGRFDARELASFEPALKPLLEAQIVDIGDALAYDSHDLDDGMRSGYLQLDELKTLELWRLAELQVAERWPQADQRASVARTVSRLIDAQVQDLLAETRRQLAALGVRSVDDVRRAPNLLAQFTPEMQRMKRELKSFLRERLYRHPRSVRMAEKGKRFIAAIFNEYLRAPGQLPIEYRKRAERDGLQVAVCDYLAGMTDRFCLREYMRLFVPYVDGAGAEGLPM